MEANPEALSSIKVNFGEKQSAPTPIDLNFTLELFSSQVILLPCSTNPPRMKLPRDSMPPCPAHALLLNSNVKRTLPQLLNSYRSR